MHMETRPRHGKDCGQREPGTPTSFPPAAGWGTRPGALVHSRAEPGSHGFNGLIQQRRHEVPGDTLRSTGWHGQGRSRLRPLKGARGPRAPQAAATDTRQAAGAPECPWGAGSGKASRGAGRARRQEEHSWALRRADCRPRRWGPGPKPTTKSSALRAGTTARE